MRRLVECFSDEQILSTASKEWANSREGRSQNRIRRVKVSKELICASGYCTIVESVCTGTWGENWSSDRRKPGGATQSWSDSPGIYAANFPESSDSRAATFATCASSIRPGMTAMNLSSKLLDKFPRTIKLCNRLLHKFGQPSAPLPFRSRSRCRRS